mgnify:CR=1 FL=1
MVRLAKKCGLESAAISMAAWKGAFLYFRIIAGSVFVPVCLCQKQGMVAPLQYVKGEYVMFYDQREPANRETETSVFQRLQADK